MKKAALLILFSCLVFGADKVADKTSTTNKDMCAPAPGSVPPSLPARLMKGNGTEYIHFPITTSNPKAQQFFLQGVAQMHSFWANEAERSFLQAAALDPSAPMPQWGIAMVAAGDFRPRFQLDRDQPVKPDGAKPDRYSQGGAARAVAAAQKAVELSAVEGKASPLEKLYVAAIAARRDANNADRDEGYIKGLRAIVAGYPGEIEARTYLALHLMRGYTLPDHQPRPGTMEAVAMLRQLLIDAPDHMGVHHFVIHGFEGATFAKDAWPSCRRYPELVPNIPHALHMPGHIWAQTGKWDEAVKSFSTAAANERGYMAADQLYGNGHHGHNVHFMATSLSFQGHYDEAMAASRELLTFKENPREAGQVDNAFTAYRQGWFAMMRTLVQNEKWDVILEDKALPVYDKPREQAWRHWALGLAHAAKGHAAETKAEAKAMDEALKDFTAKTKDPVPPPLAAARKELDGHIAAVEGNNGKAIEILQAAAKMERSMRYNEPPSYPRPVLQALGEKALAEGKLQVAEAAFREALDQYPESSRALAGLSDTLKREKKPLSAGD
jgi:tetratricopeptide (TPR) repeat protein